MLKIVLISLMAVAVIALPTFPDLREPEQKKLDKPHETTLEMSKVTQFVPGQEPETQSDVKLFKDGQPVPIRSSRQALDVDLSQARLDSDEKDEGVVPIARISLLRTIIVVLSRPSDEKAEPSEPKEQPQGQEMNETPSVIRQRRQLSEQEQQKLKSQSELLKQGQQNEEQPQLRVRRRRQVHKQLQPSSLNVEIERKEKELPGLQRQEIKEQEQSPVSRAGRDIFQPASTIPKKLPEQEQRRQELLGEKVDVQERLKDQLPSQGMMKRSVLPHQIGSRDPRIPGQQEEMDGEHQEESEPIDSYVEQLESLIGFMEKTKEHIKEEVDNVPSMESELGSRRRRDEPFPSVLIPPRLIEQKENIEKKEEQEQPEFTKARMPEIQQPEEKEEREKVEQPVQEKKGKELEQPEEELKQTLEEKPREMIEHGKEKAQDIQKPAEEMFEEGKQKLGEQPVSGAKVQEKKGKELEQPEEEFKQTLEEKPQEMTEQGKEKAQEIEEPAEEKFEEGKEKLGGHPVSGAMEKGKEGISGAISEVQKPVAEGEEKIKKLPEQMKESLPDIEKSGREPHGKSLELDQEKQAMPESAQDGLENIQQVGQGISPEMNPELKKEQGLQQGEDVVQQNVEEARSGKQLPENIEKPLEEEKLQEKNVKTGKELPEIENIQNPEAQDSKEELRSAKQLGRGNIQGTPSSENLKNPLEENANVEQGELTEELPSPVEVHSKHQQERLGSVHRVEQPDPFVSPDDDRRNKRTLAYPYYYRRWPYRYRRGYPYVLPIFFGGGLFPGYYGGYGGLGYGGLGYGGGVVDESLDVVAGDYGGMDYAGVADYGGLGDYGGYGDYGGGGDYGGYGDYGGGGYDY